MKEAVLYDKLDSNYVQCNLCRHNCKIADGKSGICNVRDNVGGVLYSPYYARPVAMSPDPIEKKPLFHFLPASQSFSIACLGCNFHCKFCQNWDISQCAGRKIQPESLQEASPEMIIKFAKDNECESISYTYTEPTVFFEYAYDCATLASANNIKNIFVTNGFMSRTAIDMIAPFLDAANVDLKAFRRETYKNVIGGTLDGVLDSIKYMHEKGIWLEITTLVIPQMNDSEKELSDIANFIASVDKNIPWHISKFWPRFKMDDREPTKVEALKSAYKAGKRAGLKYIYLGNVDAQDFENTLCPDCGKLLIARRGFSVLRNNLGKKNLCPSCGAEISGVF